MNSTQKTSYSSAAKQDVFLTKEHAIIVDAVEGIKLEDYADALELKIPAEHIQYMAKVANHRVCIYVSTKAMADELINKHQTITVGTHELRIRPLISRNKRIVISNVQPFIPHDKILETLKSMDIEVRSPMTFLSAGFSKARNAHIKGFRRQVFIKPSDVNKIPEMIHITYDGTPYIIYQSTDNPTCFTCRKEGHIAKACPSSNQTFPDTPPNNDTLYQEQTKNNDKTTNNEKALNPLESTNMETEITMNDSSTHKKNIKRVLSSSDTQSATSNESIPTPTSQETTPINTTTIMLPPPSKGKRIKKRRKGEKTSSPSSLSLAFKNKMDRNEYPLNFEQLQNLIDKTTSQKHISNIVNEFKIEPSKIVHTLNELYPHLETPGIKSKFTRLRTKIEFEFNLPPTGGTDYVASSEMDQADDSLTEADDDFLARPTPPEQQTPNSN